MFRAGRAKATDKIIVLDYIDLSKKERRRDRRHVSRVNRRARRLISRVNRRARLRRWIARLNRRATHHLRRLIRLANRMNRLK